MAKKITTKEMSPYKRRVAAQNAKGLCGNKSDGQLCQNPHEPGKKFCRACLDIEATKAEERRRKKGETGKCTYSGCQEWPEPGSKRCSKHKAKAREDRQDDYGARKAAGKCVTAGCTNPPKPGCVSCQDHIDASSRFSSERFRAFRVRGLCGYCGRPPFKPGASYCLKHKRYDASYKLDTKIQAMIRVVEVNGGGDLVCVGPAGQECPYDCTDVEVLEINHIDGGGRAHLRSLGLTGSGYPFHCWVRSKWDPTRHPERFNLLCPNCNKKDHYDRVGLGHRSAEPIVVKRRKRMS